MTDEASGYQGMDGLLYYHATVNHGAGVPTKTEIEGGKEAQKEREEVIKVRFFTGLHQPSDAKHFEAAFISVKRIRNRKGPFAVGDWIMDSGAFSEVSQHGGYRESVEEYAKQIMRWKSNGNLLAAVSQDYMCEPWILERTGLTVRDHQRLTVERYDALLRCETGCYILPVLQGYSPDDYVEHIRMYGERLTPGMWTGVGSICKRNGSPRKILEVLMAIKLERPDLRLHGFGLKKTSLDNVTIRALLETADSMAWSFAARKNGTGANDWRNAASFKKGIEIEPTGQRHFIELLAG